MTRAKNVSQIPAAAIAAAFFWLSAPLLAHHGAAAYDTTRMVTVKGTVTDFQFVNPHAEVFFRVKNDRGEPEVWQGELTAPNRLSRIGWSSRTLKPGDSIAVIGNRAKNGGHLLLVRKIIGPKGASLPLYEN
jgi:hypothetical protein